MNTSPVSIKIADYLLDYANNKFYISSNVITPNSLFFRIFEQNISKISSLNGEQCVMLSSVIAEKDCIYSLSQIGNNMLSNMILSLLYSDLTSFVLNQNKAAFRKKKTIELFMLEHKIGHEGRENILRQYYRNVRDRVSQPSIFKTYQA